MTAKRFTLDKWDCITDNESTAKDGGKEVYWLVEYVQQQKLVENINNLAGENKKLQQFKEKVFALIDKRIQTLKANSKQCHQCGSHEKGIEFTLQAELLERLKKELEE